MNETPDTTNFMVAAYTVTALIILAYAGSLFRRAGRRD